MLSALIAIAVILLDQISKHFVCTNLKPIGSIPIIDGILNFTYVENTGAAFGILSDKRAVFMIVSVLVIVVLSIVVVKFQGQSKLFDVCLGLIVGGGVGNMVDRAFLGYVIDFIDFCAFDFWKWVFNIADSAVAERVAVIRNAVFIAAIPLVVRCLAACHFRFDLKRCHFSGIVDVDLRISVNSTK